MRVHHLNCATFCLRPGALFSPAAGFFSSAKLVCHCLLIESSAGLVLVDTGIGLMDIAEPATRLGRLFVAISDMRLDPEETAQRQVERLGFRARDVRHIVLTHLDLDHAGGISDFPKAKVHVMGAELDAASTRATPMERLRYREVHWSHHPEWVRHSPAAGEKWFGFERARALTADEMDILLIPVAGHTRGHAAVAVRTQGKWLLHAGDAYFFHGEMSRPRSCPKGFDVFQRVIAVDDRQRLLNQDRLRACANEHAGEIEMFCAHDVVEFERIRTACSRA